MQRAVAIALAGGLLAASAGAFALAQVLKLERSPIEAIRVDPTPNHDRGRLDRHDSALFSPRCSAPCLSAAEVRFRVHTSGPVRAEVVAPGGHVVRDLGALPHPGGRVVARWNGRDAAGAVAARRLLPAEGQPLGPQHRAAQPACARHDRALLGTNVSRRVISPDCDAYGDRVHRRRARARAARGRAAPGAGGRPRSCAPCASASRARALAVSWPPYDRQALHDCARWALPAAPDRTRRARQHARARRRRGHGARRRALARPTARSSPASACGWASRPTRAACASISRGSAPRARAARARHARARGGRAHPGRGAGRHLRRRQPARRPHRRERCWRCAARGPPASRCCVTGARRAALAPLPAAARRARHPLRRRHDARRARGHARRLRGARRAGGRRRARTRSRAFSS